MGQNFFQNFQELPTMHLIKHRTIKIEFSPANVEFVFQFLLRLINYLSFLHAISTKFLVNVYFYISEIYMKV